MSEHIGIILCGHGSRDSEGVDQFASLVKAFIHRSRDLSFMGAITHGYLEFARPILREGLDYLKVQQTDRIIALPVMLFAAGHAKNDIPSVLNQWQVENHISVEYGCEMGLDSRMIRAASECITQAIDHADSTCSYHDSLLIVVGRGSSDPDANGNVAKLTRMLWEGLGFGFGMVAYSGVTFPLIGPCLERAIRLGFKRIIVFPYFLFTGILVRRIYEQVDLATSCFPQTQIIKAPYLNAHPLVVDTLLTRFEETLNGNPAMNCQLCKYRESILGFEDEVGLPQKSHHHHVEGIGSAHVNLHHNHDSADGGHHHPYPHRDHPLGPYSGSRHIIDPA